MQANTATEDDLVELYHVITKALDPISELFYLLGMEDGDEPDHEPEFPELEKAVGAALNALLGTTWELGQRNAKCRALIDLADEQLERDQAEYERLEKNMTPSEQRAWLLNLNRRITNSIVLRHGDQISAEQLTIRKMREVNP